MEKIHENDQGRDTAQDGPRHQSSESGDDLFPGESGLPPWDAPGAPDEEPPGYFDPWESECSSADDELFGDDFWNAVHQCEGTNTQCSFQDETCGPGVGASGSPGICKLGAPPSAERPSFHHIEPMRISGRFCPHSHKVRCVCMSALRENKKYLLKKKDFYDLYLIHQEVQCGFALGKVKELRAKYQNHVLVKIALLERDSKFSLDWERKKVLRALYNLRMVYGRTHDFGKRPEIDFLVGQSEEQETTGFCGRVIDMVKNLVGKGATTLKGFLTSVFDKVLGGIKNLVGIFSSTIAKVINRALDAIYSICARLFCPYEKVKDFLKDGKTNMLVATIAMVLIVVAIDMIGIMTFRLTKKFIDSLMTNLLGPKKEMFEGQGPITGPGVVVSMLGVFLGMSRYDMGLTAIASKCRELNSILLAGLGATGAVGALITILPTAVSDLLVRLFGSQAEKEKVMIDSWLINAHALLSLSRITKMILYPKFQSLLTESYQEGLKLRRQLTDKNVMSLMTPTLTGIIKLYGSLVTAQCSGRMRSYPFSFHIFGAPGVSKSLICKPLTNAVFPGLQVYERNIGDPYWSGYMAQEVIVYDEFLATDQATREATANEYLSLVSNKPFKPNMPSVDDVSVGIKGVECAAVGVVTINNDPYTSMPCANQDAIFRRRAFVIKVEMADAYATRFNKNRIDMSKLSDGEIKELKWLKFSILPHSPSGRPYGESFLARNLTFREMAEYVREARESHERICQQLDENLNPLDEAVDPESLLRDTIRDLRGVSNKPIGLMESLSSFFGSLFSPESETPEFNEGLTGQAGKKKKQPVARPKPSRQRMDDGSTGERLLPTGSTWGDIDEIVNNPAGHSSDYDTTSEGSSDVPAHFDVNVVVENAQEDKEEPDKDDEPEEFVFEERERCSYSQPGDGSKEDMNPELSPSWKRDLIEELEKGEVFPSITQLNIKKALSHKLLLLLKVQCSQEKVQMVEREIKELKGRICPAGVLEFDAFRKRFARNISYPINKETISDVAHCGVIQTEFHRHRCPVCDKQFAHKHENRVHDNRCKRCRADDKWENPMGSPLNNFTKIVKEDIYDIPWELIELTPEEKHELKKKMLKAAVEAPIMVLINTVWAYDARNDKYFPVGETIKSAFKSVTTVLGASILVYSAIKAFSVWRERRNGQEPEFIVFGESVGKRAKTTKSERSFSAKPKGQGPKNPLSVIVDGVEYKSVPIRGRTFLTYDHGLGDAMDVTPGLELLVRYNGKTDRVLISDCYVVNDFDNDLIYVTLPNEVKIDQFPSMVKQFITESDLEQFDTLRVRLDIAGRARFSSGYRVKSKTYACEVSKRTLAEGLAYYMETRSGDCGTLVQCAGNTFPGKYLGIHVAGGSENGVHFGMATLITQQQLLDALDGHREAPPNFLGEVSGQGPYKDFPNLLAVKKIPPAEQVKIPNKTKLTPSILSPYLEEKPKKQLPILSGSDPRSKFDRPAMGMSIELMKVEQAGVDEGLLRKVANETYRQYHELLDWPVGKRILTIKEAIGGIPGMLSSLDVATSPGYPLVKMRKKKGKQDSFYFDEKGNLVIEDDFEENVMSFIREWKEKTVASRFLVFLKDELITESKAQQGRARIIYGADLISLVAFRMYYGALIVAIHWSFRRLPSSIGMNQYSWDMNTVYSYLSEVGENFIAGDYKSFDKRMNGKFQEKAYQILCTLSGWVDLDLSRRFILHQTKSPAQCHDCLFRYDVVHYSGCLFTTIVNNLVNEMYIRYCFHKLTRLEPLTNLRVKVYGDDHIISVSDRASAKFNPILLAKELGKLGQIYTSAEKDKELTERLVSFGEITFLGSKPQLLMGRWIGLMSWDTIMESLHWTRNQNATIIEEAVCATEYASLWGKEKYNDLVARINKCFEENGLPHLERKCPAQLALGVAARTADSSMDWKMDFLKGQAPTLEPGLTKMHIEQETQATLLNNNAITTLTNRALDATMMDLQFSTDSTVKREVVQWTIGNPIGAAIWEVDLPHGLLAKGDQNNLQNMPFTRYTYWSGDVEVLFQMNGHQFTQGLLVAYFVPLADYQVEIANITSLPHVILNPKSNSTSVLKVPFQYFRTMMNTHAGTTESLGSVFLAPLSVLQANVTQMVNITIYSRFPESKFFLPKPNLIPQKKKTIHYVHPGRSPEEKTIEAPMVGQGQSVSTMVSNTYQNYAGVMPIQDNPISIGTQAEQSIDGSLEAKIPMPLDNPPLCSGGFSVHQTYQGFSNCVGVRNTNDLQLFPGAFNREPMGFFNPEDTKIENLVSKRCLLARFTCRTSNPTGTVLLRLVNDSRMSLAEGEGVPINVVILNQFMFWRGDVELEFVAARTMTQSVRLQVLVGYGVDAIDVDSASIAFSHILDFSDNVDSQSVVINYNHQTEFLRTYEGDGAIDPVQNYVHSCATVLVANPMVAPTDLVPAFVEFLVFVRFRNVHVAVPRAYSPFTMNDYLKIKGVESWMKPTNGKSVNGLGEISYNIIIVPRNGVTVHNGVDDETYEIGGVFNLSLLDAAGVLLRRYPRLEGYRMHLTANVITLMFRTPLSPPSSWDSVNSTLEFGLIPMFDRILRRKVTDTKEDPQYTKRKTDMSEAMKTLPTGYALKFLSKHEKDAKLFHRRLENVKMSGQGTEVDTMEQINVGGEVKSTTEDTYDHTVKVPCKLDLGRKFEGRVVDIHELGRRYIRVSLKENDKLDQFVRVSYVINESGKSMTYYNVSVQIQSKWRACFAAWSGSVKYRIIERNGEIGNVIFQPFMNTHKKVSIPLNDVIAGNAFNFGDALVTSDTAIAGDLARERMYQFSDTQFIDVSAPFQTHFNFLMNGQTQDVAPIASGTIGFSLASDDDPEIYTAFGDDTRLGIFRPPQRTAFSLSGFSSGVAGFF